MSGPVVSVIIPTFNAGKYITQTIESVLAQSLAGIEVLIIDDESSDNTVAIVESFGGPVRLIQQNNAGVCVARNRGITEATGEFICFMDHDDYWFPEKLELQVNAMRNGANVGVVYTEFIRWNEDGSGRFPEPATTRPNMSTAEIDQDYSGWIYHKLLIDCWVLTSTSMIRRAVFDRCGVFDTSLPFSEDWDLWLRISRHFQFLKLRQATTLYRQHPTQGSRVARPIDYRTRLLAQAERQWGLASQDGQSVTRKAFNEQMYRYHMSYAMGCVRARMRTKAAHAFIAGWWRRPTSPKPLIYIAAMTLGWRPA